MFFAPSSIPVWALTQYQCTFDTFCNHRASIWYVHSICYFAWPAIKNVTLTEHKDSHTYLGIQILLLNWRRRVFFQRYCDACQLSLPTHRRVPGFNINDKCHTLIYYRKNKPSNVIFKALPWELLNYLLSCLPFKTSNYDLSAYKPYDSSRCFWWYFVYCSQTSLLIDTLSSSKNVVILWYLCSADVWGQGCGRHSALVHCWCHRWSPECTLMGIGAV